MHQVVAYVMSYKAELWDWKEWSPGVGIALAFNQSRWVTTYFFENPGMRQ